MNSIMINKKTIITNLRVPSEDWNQLKAIAAERGMSANEYINFLMRNVITPHLAVKGGSENVWDMPKLAKKAKKRGELSADDKIIYE